jgi:hypothetical protein
MPDPVHWGFHLLTYHSVRAPLVVQLTPHSFLRAARFQQITPYAIPLSLCGRPNPRYFLPSDESAQRQVYRTAYQPRNEVGMPKSHTARSCGPPMQS